MTKEMLNAAPDAIKTVGVEGKGGIVATYIKTVFFLVTVIVGLYQAQGVCKPWTGLLD